MLGLKIIYVSKRGPRMDGWTQGWTVSLQLSHHGSAGLIKTNLLIFINAQLYAHTPMRFANHKLCVIKQGIVSQIFNYQQLRMIHLIHWLFQAHSGTISAHNLVYYLQWSLKYMVTLFVTCLPLHCGALCKLENIYFLLYLKTKSSSLKSQKERKNSYSFQWVSDKTNS